MRFNIERKLIESKISSEWTKTNVAWENLTFTPNDQPYIKVMILTGNGQKQTIGSGTFLFPSSLVVEIYTKKSQGTGLMREIADDLSTMFTDIDIVEDDVKLSFGSPGIASQMEDGNFVKTNFIIPFDRIHKGN